MTHNIYDNPDFFAGYSRLPRSVEGLDGAPEWPALRAMLPDLQGARVLDLGCGFGWFCRWARAAGAAEVVGIDVSERMLARARSATADPAIRYARADLEAAVLPENGFDLIYSSLALHYLENLDGLLAQAHRALRPNGTLVFSVEHPLFTAPAEPGWGADPSGRRSWLLNSYLEQGPRRTDWLAKGVVKQHRTMADWLMPLLRRGFRIAHVEEWAPTSQQVAAHPEWADECIRPPFLLIGAAR